VLGEEEAAMAKTQKGKEEHQHRSMLFINSLEEKYRDWYRQ
jgi:hypothetical protein